MILSEFIWFNSNTKVDSKPVHFSFFFSDKNLNFIGQLFNDNGNVKPWEDIKIEFHLQDTRKYASYKLLMLRQNRGNILLKEMKEMQKFSYF